MERIESSPRAVPDLSLVADEDGAIVGHILLSHVDLIGPREGREVLALGPMAVLPAHQRRRVGSELVRAGIAAAEVLGERLIVVLGHAQYYPRFGFLPASLIGIEPPDGLSVEHYFVLPLTGYDPALRGRVVYGPEWGIEVPARET